ncbi:MAG: hypothetical protein SNH35_00725 [Rikenellaceae bacterium]
MQEIINEAALLVLLNAQMSYPLFKEDKTLLSTTKLPFYKEYVLVKAKTFSTIPSVEINFLWSEKGNRVIKIDGDKDCFFDNVEALKPHITPQTAVAYIKFVLGSVYDDNGAIRVCERVEDIKFSSNPSDSQRLFLNKNIKPATIAERNRMIVVNCNIVYGTSLYRAEIELQYNGMFDITKEECLGSNIEPLRTIFLK